MKRHALDPKSSQEDGKVWACPTPTCNGIIRGDLCPQCGVRLDRGRAETEPPQRIALEPKPRGWIVEQYDSTEGEWWFSTFKEYDIEIPESVRHRYRSIPVYVAAPLEDR